jgi:WS/DGAT/MGAT family acyltransferase
MPELFTGAVLSDHRNTGGSGHETGARVANPPVAGRRIEPLRADDAFFLHAETAGVQQHVGGLALLDPSPRPDGRITLDELGSRLTWVLGMAPRLRQRLAVPLGRLARPAWVEDDSFDLDQHLRGLEVAAPGGRRELEAAVEAVMAQPIDRARPLWEAYLLDGLADGQQAILLKLHHAIADGIGALTIAERLFDSGPTESKSGAHSAPPPAGQAESDGPNRGGPGRAEVLATSLGHQMVAPWRDLVAAGLRAAANRQGVWRQARRTVAGVWQLAEGGRAPATPLNGPVQRGRRIVLADVSRAEIDAARRHHGGTANDVLLAAVAHAVHDWLAANGDGPVPEVVRTMVPVSTRREREAPGTWTATLDIDLPVGDMTPDARLREVTAATRRAKRSSQSVGSRFVMSTVGTWAPPLLHARFARFAYRGRWFNLIVSNVPGPRRPLYLAGARVVTAYPIMPLAEDVGLTIGAITWPDQMTIEVTADPSRVSGAESLARGLVECIKQLAKGEASAP